jgi:predicted enzyme related to lactoylglutathione lyase
MATGLGGVFIKAANPKYLARWYDDNLGIGFRNSLYFSFKWRDISKQDDISYTTFSFFKQDTGYFFPGSNAVMLNLRVSDLDSLRIQLKNDGAQVIDKVESHEYGRFGWVLDPEGNKIELWEPVDEGFEDIHFPMDLKSVTGFGGIFLKALHPDKQMTWYSKHFDLYFENSIHTFQWKDFSDLNLAGQTLFSFLPLNTAYFNPSPKSYMINFRVNDLNTLLSNLDSSEISFIDKKEEYKFGKFAWILDPENNKIELWEPFR